MRYVQLRAFHYVALYGGFSRAAAELHLTQPAVSDQVRKLEEQYDVLLFQRRYKPVTLTPTGEKLLEITRRLFDARGQAEEFLNESLLRSAGALRIVVDSALHVSPLLGRYRRDHPDVELILSTGNSARVLEQLRHYRADLGVLGELPGGQTFTALRLSSTPLVAFVARGHALAGRRRVTLARLSRETLVLRERGSKTRQKFEYGAAAKGLSVSAAIEAEGREAVREIVATGVGVGIVSAAEFGADPRFLPLTISDCSIMMDEALVCLRERAAVERIRRFFAIARAHHEADEPDR